MSRGLWATIGEDDKVIKLVLLKEEIYSELLLILIIFIEKHDIRVSPSTLHWMMMPPSMMPLKKPRAQSNLWRLSGIAFCELQ